MAARILTDLIRDSGLQAGPNGLSLDRTFAIVGLPIADTKNPDPGILLAAITTAGVPQYGEPHPKNADYGIDLRARGYRMKGLGGNNSALLVVTYVSQVGITGLGRVIRNYSSGVAWEQQDTDFDGNPIKVIYRVHNGEPGVAPPGDAKVLKAGGSVSGPFPFKRILITRFFNFGFSAPIWIDPFVGNKNRGLWVSENVADGDGLVMGVDANTEDGFNYKVTWDTMVRPEEGWDAYAAYVLPTGQRPYNAFNGFLGNGVNNGFAKVVVTGDVDLNIIA